MTTLVEVSDLHRHLGINERSQQGRDVSHLVADDEGLGRSYVCSMSSAVELGGQDGADLAQNVQRYLCRIVEELHLISAWSSSIYQQQPRVAISSVPVEDSRRVDDNSFTAMARLAVVTDIELMRRDVAKTQHELFQRCTTQMAYVKSEVQAAIGQQETLYSQLKQRVDETQRVCVKLTQSVRVLEKSRAENEAQVRALTATLRQVQQQTANHPARISILEESKASTTAAQFSHEQELQTLHRRVESNETAHHSQLEATRRAAEDSLAGLRSANAQLSAKMQVLRLELQELSDSTQKRMQQFLKAVANNAPGKSASATVAPRRPSVANLRSGGTVAVAPSQTAELSIKLDTLDVVLGGGAQAKVITGTEAVTSTSSDCFIYAKAALPQSTDTSSHTKKPVAPSSGSSRALISPGGASSVQTNDTKSQDGMAYLLTVQQSVMSVPLGYEEAVRPTISVGVPKARPDPIIPTKRGTRRHNSLPDVNTSVPQGSHTPQASRLHSKLQ